MNRPLILLAALLLVGLLVWSQRSPETAEVARTALIMGTLVEIKGVDSDEKKIESAISDAFSVMRQVEQKFSPKIPESDLSILNRTMVAREVSPQMRNLIKQGQWVRQQSGGAFSMGLGAVKELWQIEAVEPQIPEPAALAAILPNPDVAQILIDGSRVQRFSPLVVLDLGGIAKGFAVDKALDVLRDAGLESASVNAGGDIGLLGGHANRPWRIGIQHPRKAGELLATLEARNQAIVTSGDYERFFIRDGVRYHHIFDPRTGQPARGCQSVTVVTAHAAKADALATAAFVLGPQAGLKLLERLPDVEGLIVAADGGVAATSGLKDRLSWR